MNEVIFSDKDCDFIKSFFKEELASNGSDPLIVELESTTLKVKRKASAKYIDVKDSLLIDFLISKLNFFKIKSIENKTAKIVKYSQGDYFEKHTDFNKYGKGANYKTLVIQLSNEDNYSGGDLIVEGLYQNRKKGSVIIFSSDKEHEVTRVEKGTRYSLTLFLSGKDFIRDISFI